MIPVRRPDLIDAAWDDWCNRARAAMTALVNAYQPGATVAINDAFYKEAMPFLKRIFHDKCAYCETVISSNQPGDVEHYRPKGRIRTDAGVLKVKIADVEVEHPGYWWLAYDWRNLMPACIDCNRRRRHDEAGGSAGKADFFEIRGTRALVPGDNLKDEQALLLDPSMDGFNPDAHFEFHEDGTMKPLSDEATHSEWLLGLNLREKLVGQRRLAYQAAQNAFSAFMNLAVTVAQSGSIDPAVLLPTRQQINDMWEGRSEYSAFARHALDAARTRLQTRTGVRIELPLP